jgi:hypothetical protein
VIPKNEQEARDELNLFEQWLLQNKKGGHLSNPERAILNTYFAWKTQVAKEKAPQPSP